MTCGVRLRLRLEIFDLLLEVLGEDFQWVDLVREVFVVLGGLAVEGHHLNTEVFSGFRVCLGNNRNSLNGFRGIGDVLGEIVDPSPPLQKVPSPDGLLILGGCIR